MALKAGTVGLNPKFVDNNGAPITKDVDAYTKAQVDEKLAAKANISYLTANNKKFQFAYDSESGKYGYKAGAQDDFHPFESAGSAGWNAPADLTHDDLTFTKCSYVKGGYYVDDGIVYVDIIVERTESGDGVYIVGLPRSVASLTYVGSQIGSSADSVDVYTDIQALANVRHASQTPTDYIEVSGLSVNGYGHYFGEYALNT